MDILIKLTLYGTYSLIVVYFLQVVVSYLSINALNNNEDLPLLIKVIAKVGHYESIKVKVLYRLLPLTIFTSLITWGF